METQELEYDFLWKLRATELSNYYETASLKLYASGSSKLERKKWADGYPVDLHTLFKSFKLKFLVSGKGEKVDHSFLKEKDVGLFFYSSMTENSVFSTLGDMYDELREQGIEFELVFICLRDLPIRVESIEDNFSKGFRGKTWLASPFLQWKSNEKLFRELCLHSDPFDGAKLVIVQQNYNIAHTYALDIFLEFGIEAYPFSKSRVTELEVVRLKSLTLHSLCSPKPYLSPRSGSDGQQVLLDQLMGKNIIFFLTTHLDDNSDDGRRDKLIHQKVSGWCIEMKQKVPEFEMVRLVYNYKKSFGKVCECCNGKMPWLEFPSDNKHEMKAVFEEVFNVARYSSYDFLPMFVAFGQDGKFRSMTSLDRFVDDGTIVDNYAMFFEDGHLYREVRDYIARCKSWSTVDEETGECYIPQ